MGYIEGLSLQTSPPKSVFVASIGKNVFAVFVISATADDSASQPAHQCPPLSEEFSHSFNPGSSQRLQSRAQRISERAQCESEGSGSVRAQGESAGRARQQVTAYTGTRRASRCSFDMENKPRFCRQLLSQQARVLTQEFGAFWLTIIPQTIPQPTKTSLLRTTVFACMGPKSRFQDTSIKDQTGGVWL